MDQNIKIKRLGYDDWQDLKAIRLEALLNNPQVFLRRYDDEIKQDDSYWQRSFVGEAAVQKAIFGLYANGVIIGMGGIHPEADIARAARLGGAYISAPYRGRGLAHGLIKARLDWARASALHDAAYVSHRKGNAPSKAAIEKAGFALAEQKMILWPDGAEAAEYIYKLKL
jgi:RimJ/RimL family protein N-acetyltransferase|tara:strand:- start:114987 stop:115496 length:510 start_codon:yes stop_codon:yes gene_type:complete